jgi:hypothetical protein
LRYWLQTALPFQVNGSGLPLSARSGLAADGHSLRLWPGAAATME